MKKITLLMGWVLGCSLPVLAQPANNTCATAIPVASTSCVNGTTTGADDSWLGSVGCQTGGNHDDVWYSFVATQNQLNINVVSTGIGNNIEFVLAESPCGNCGCSFIIAGDACGPSPLVDSIVGLNVGATYYYTISSSGSNGGFTSCITSVNAVNVPGQDCISASNICNRDPFGQGTVASGNGTIRGTGSQEDVNTLSCFGSSERQSQWYRFTASNTGTIQFNINPLVSSDDYDFLLLDVTTSGCNLLSGPATVVACNWSGCKGSTGISSAVLSEPGVQTSGAGCFGGPAAWVTTPPTITACRNYLLLIDNFSLSNSGFNFTWGGATNGMTATIGPEGILGFTPTVISTSPCQIGISGVTNRACYNYSWTWGDGSTSTGPAPAAHTYASGGVYTITQTITDANGCVATTSQTVSCILAEGDVKLVCGTDPGRVNLHWSIPHDMSPDQFILQHSLDGQSFSDFEYIKDLNGVREAGYDAVHTAPVPGQNYYRVIARDAQGVFHPSDVVRVLYDSENANLSLWPNPAENQVEISFQTDRPGPVKFELLDMQGRLVRVVETQAAGGQQTAALELNGLASGAYYVKATTHYSVFTRSFVKK